MKPTPAGCAAPRATACRACPPGRPTPPAPHCSLPARGMALLRSAALTKGLCFTAPERQTLHLRGLLPPAVCSMEEELVLTALAYGLHSGDLARYMYLASLLQKNERLFYRFAEENLEAVLPIIYNPTVAAVSENYGALHREAPGIFVSLEDKGNIYSVLGNLELDAQVVVLTSGERVMGLRDMGAHGMAVALSKATLCTLLGGVRPERCLAIAVDAGTDNGHLAGSPLYVGLRRPRQRGPEWDDFVAEVMAAVARRYGARCVIHYTSFGYADAFRILDNYRNFHCSFNEDIQCTAAVVLAAITASSRITRRNLRDEVFLFFGAGQASLGIALLCVFAMSADGVDQKRAREHIWLMDAEGLVVADRPGALDRYKFKYVKPELEKRSLLKVVQAVKPTVLVGAASVADAFTPDVLAEMAENHETPVVFALSDPHGSSECSAEAAVRSTEGRGLFASGCPYPPVTFRDKTFRCSHSDNMYIFPGLALAALCVGVKRVTDDLLLSAATTLAQEVTDGDLAEGRLLPPTDKLRGCSLLIATRLAELAYKQGNASVLPEPKDKRQFIVSQMYVAKY